MTSITPSSIRDTINIKGTGNWTDMGLSTCKGDNDSCDTFFYMFGAAAGPELMGRICAEYGLPVDRH